MLENVSNKKCKCKTEHFVQRENLSTSAENTSMSFAGEGCASRALHGPKFHTRPDVVSAQPGPTWPSPILVIFRPGPQLPSVIEAQPSLAWLVYKNEKKTFCSCTNAVNRLLNDDSPKLKIVRIVIVL